MSSTTIVNGAPMVRSLGTQDASKRIPVIEPEAIPTHCPKVYIYAAKGPTGPQLVVGDGRNEMYGDDTFDLRMPFATHQTVLSNLVNAQGNAQMIERLIPVDAGPKANFTLWLDVLPTDIPQYQRDSQGKFIVDGVTGLPIPTVPASTKAGFKVKWVVTSIATNPLNKTDLELFANQATTPGDQTDGTEQSQRYPILSFWANSQGGYFSNSGLRLWAPTEATSGAVNDNILSGNKAFPFKLAAIRRVNAQSSARIVEAEDGSPNIDFTFKEGQINAATDALISLGDLYPKVYQELSDPRFQPKYADLSGLHIYQDNIEELVTQFYAAEKDEIDPSSDWTLGATDEAHKFNFLTGVSSQDGPYYTFLVDTAAAGSVRLSESTNLFAGGGSDGTMNETLFAGLVETAVAEYANENSELMDTAFNVESIVYDTGFPLQTKYALCKVLAERKDIGVVLSTYSVGGQQLTAAEDHSIAVALRTRLQMYPDSDYFGTPVFRGVIIGRNGILRGSQYTKRLPITLELAVKAAKMMGAGNGSWKSEELFDKAPLSEITMFDDINIAFTPAKQRNKDWDVGLNYPMRFSRKSLFFPALKTVYDNDTSVLNSFFVMMACIEIQKVGERVHRHFTGSVSLTDAQLVDRVNKKVEELTVGRFANMFKIVPAAYLTDADVARGFSWTLPIKLYANNMKTVQTLSIEARRMSDLDAAA